MYDDGQQLIPRVPGTAVHKPSNDLLQQHMSKDTEGVNKALIVKFMYSADTIE